MPKVSQAHRDARRRQILDAARTCFGREGFHAASMHDVIAEAGLSAGAVYRYFAGKEELIAAIAAEVIGEIGSAFAAGASSDPPASVARAFGDALETLERLDEEQGIAPLALQVWGEAARSPALAEHLRVAVGQIESALAELVAVDQERGLIASDVPAGQVAKLLRGLLPSFLLQRAVLGDVDAAGFRAGLGAILGPPPPGAG